MAVIEARSIGRDFPGVTALDGVDLSLELGRVHVLAGENGAGKSTLVKILTGADTPSRGIVLIDGADALHHPHLFRRVAYVPQEINLFPHMSVAENLFIPFDRSKTGTWVVSGRNLNREAQRYIDRFKIQAAPHQLVRNVAVSDQQLIQIARAYTNKELQVLILDEPTSALTATEVERVFSIITELRETDHAVVFISHRMEEIFAIGDELTVLRNGQRVGHCKMADIAEGELIHLMSGEEVKINDVFRSQLAGAETILAVRDLSGEGFENISFDLRRGEVLGFAGLVGAGRSEVMQTIFGYRPARSGSVRVAGSDWKLGSTTFSVEHGMLYLSEERKLHGILPFLSVRDNIGISILDKTVRSGVISGSGERAEVQRIIDRYDIKTPSMRKRIMFLSGGNQQKAIIGRAMARDPRVLIFDEPTKGIDVRTKVEIYKIMKSLAESGVGIILVSSEMEELRKCATRIITMFQGRISGEFSTAETDNRSLVAAILGSQEGRQVA